MLTITLKFSLISHCYFYMNRVWSSFSYKTRSPFHGQICHIFQSLSIKTNDHWPTLQFSANVTSSHSFWLLTQIMIYLRAILHTAFNNSFNILHTLPNSIKVQNRRKCVKNGSHKPYNIGLKSNKINWNENKIKKRLANKTIYWHSFANKITCTL